MKKLSLTLVIVLLMAVAPAATYAQTTLYVDDDLSECPAAAYTAIQDAIDAASPGDTVHVCAGTYEEQLDIELDLALEGDGQGLTIVRSPTTLVSKFSTTTTNKPVVYAHNATVAIRDMTVDGAGRGNGNYRFIGIAYYDAGGSVQRVEIVHITESPLSGSQHGVGLYALNQDGASRTLLVARNTISNYQKNGMALLGSGLEVTVVHNTVTGFGETTAIAQNGIQVGLAAKGSVNNNSVADNFYNGPTWTASGYLVSESDGVVISHNDSENNQTAVYLFGNENSANNNDIDPSTWGFILYGNGNHAKNNSIAVNEIGLFLYGDGNQAVSNRITCGSDPGDVGVYVIGEANHAVRNRSTGCEFGTLDLGIDTLVKPPSHVN